MDKGDERHDRGYYTQKKSNAPLETLLSNFIIGKKFFV